MVGLVCFCGCGSHFSRSELNMITWCPIDIGDNVAVVTVTVVIIALITILPNAKCKVQMCRYYIFENAVHNFVQYLYTLSGLIGCVCVCSTRLLCTHTQHAKWLARPEPHTLIKHMWSIVCCDAHAKRSKYHSNGWFFFYFVIFLKFSPLILCQIALIETHIQYIYIY